MLSWSGGKGVHGLVGQERRAGGREAVAEKLNYWFCWRSLFSVSGR
jgi:hypothetical protein